MPAAKTCFFVLRALHAAEQWLVSYDSLLFYNSINEIIIARPTRPLCSSVSVR